MTKNKWFRFTILYLSATALSLSQLKLSPIQENLGLSVASYTWLMSIFMVSALVLALPGGSLLSKFGAKKMGIFIMACLVFGNIIGALSTDSQSVTNYGLLLFSRILEGVSFSMINLIAMVFIGDWFKDGGIGTAIGIFGTFSALASMIGMNLYLPIFRTFGLSSVWYFTATLAVIGLLGYVFLLDDNVSVDEQSVKSSYREVFTDKSTWFLATAMGCMSFVLFTFITFYPRIFTEFFNINIDIANSYSGLFGLFGVPFGFIAGFLIDRFKINSLILGIITALLMAFSCWLIAFISPQFVLLQIFIASVGISMYSSCIAISVPKTVKRPILIGQTFAVVYLFYYIGVFIGSPIIIFIVELFNSWIAGAFAMGVVSTIGMLSLLILMILNKKRLFNSI